MDYETSNGKMAANCKLQLKWMEASAKMFYIVRNLKPS